MELKDIMTMQEVQEMKQQLEQVFSFYCTSAGWRNTGNRRGNRAPMSVLFHMG